MRGDKSRHWREDITDLHIAILQILARQPAMKSLHYSRITQKINYEAGLFNRPVEVQFRQDTINRRIVELRRRGYVQMTDKGKNRITGEGILFLENLGKRPPVPPPLDESEREGITTRPEGEKPTAISLQRKRGGIKVKGKNVKRKAAKAMGDKSQRTLEFSASGTLKVG